MSSPSSLFSERSSSSSSPSPPPLSPTSTSQPPRPPSPRPSPPSPPLVATLKPPVIPGLYLFPAIVPEKLASSLVASIAEANLFLGGERDQVMLFGGFPEWLVEAETDIRDCLVLLKGGGYLEEEEKEDEEMSVIRRAFSRQGRKGGRQAILNLYRPGTGITPHVDLPNRYDTPIVSISLLSSTVFYLRRRRRRKPLASCWRQRRGREGGGEGGGRRDGGDAAAEESQGEGQGEEEWEEYRFLLPERSVMILDGEARWEWEHGIEERLGDYVEDPDGQEEGGRCWRGRGTRVSVTLRWMKEGGDVVGGEEKADKEGDDGERSGEGERGKKRKLG